MWIDGYCYPCYPATNSFEDYFDNLKIGSVFAYNDYSPKLIIVEFIVDKDKSSICLMCERESVVCEENDFFPWTIFEITFINSVFVHTKIGAYFDKEDADKDFLCQAVTRLVIDYCA